MQLKKYLIMFVALTTAVLSVGAQSLSIGNVMINNVGMSQRLIRLTERGIIAENAGMHLKVQVSVNAVGLAGKRILCIVNPLDEEGNMLGDSRGEAMSVVAVNVPRASSNMKVTVPMPYQWVVNEDNRSMNAINLGVQLVCMSEEGVEDLKMVKLSGNDIRIDKSKIGENMMGEIFGGSGGMAGAILGGLFDTSDASSEQECPSCEGRMLCPHCDGDAYLDPSLCRKCIDDPGFCYRCKGEGTIVRKYDIY